MPRPRDPPSRTRSRKHQEVRMRFLRGRPAPPVDSAVGPGARRSRRLPALLSAAVLLLASVVPLSLTAFSGPAGAASGPDVGGGGDNEGGRGDVIASLFEWNWSSVANECTNVLGPAGYGGVQV